MRELLYVPIIHSEADLGSLGTAIDKRSTSLYGEKRWTEHKETVAKFWRSVADYLLSLDAASLRIYQDGLAANGELGRRIVEEAAKRGSVNHQIILQLLNKGAELRKTEDASLLMEELRLAREECAGEDISNHQELSFRRSRLIEERDKFIAKTINETLRQGETAVLFIGAYHNVHFYLPEDIAIEYLKEPERVKGYFKELISGGRGKRFEQLAHYLVSPVAIHRRA
ncbi:MAG: hypothetical protein QMD88_06815 [Coprothermobacterota bacterium]|nr:hypothetical protein [Coprothermobacterota bacterium]